MQSRSRKKESYTDFVSELTENGDDKKFTTKMNNFLSYHAKHPALPNPPVSTLADLLNHNLIVGEGHSESAAKKFLIKNMQLLKDNGYQIFFTEGLSYAFQSDLDQFDLSSNSNKIVNRLKEIDYEYEFNPKNGYTDVVVAAKSMGLRVVGLETEEDPQEESLQRIKKFNYNAYQIITRELQQLNSFQASNKWVVLTGAHHAKTIAGIPGIADLTHANTVILRDKNNRAYQSFNQIDFNHDYKSGKYQVKVEARIIVDPLREAPLLSDKQEMTITQVTNSINNYHIYKNGFFGLRKLKTTSDETRKAMNDLQLAGDDQQRFAVAYEYIHNNPDKAFANELKDVLWPRKKSA